MKFFNKNISPILILGIMFVVSRLVYYSLGIRFEFFPSYWQILPLDLLKNDLLVTIFYNFSQPPLLNFLVGIGLKIGNHILFLHLFYLFFGLLAFINFYKISKFAITENISLFLTCFLMILPLTLLWENHGYKDYLTMCFFINSFYYSLKILNKDNYVNYLFLGINITLLSILRETFHFFWIIIFLIFEFICNRRIKKSFFILLMIIFFVLPFYMKNLIIFNKFQIAGWMYENLTQKTLYIQQMKSGKYQSLKNIIFKNEENFNNFTNRLSVIQGNTFQPVSDYRKILNYNSKYNHPLLQSETFHNEVMLRVDEIRKKDFYLYLKEYPQVFFVTVFNSLVRHYFNSSENFLFIENNVKKIPKLVRFSHCLKLTLLCISNENDKLSRKSYSTFSIKEKIYFSLQQLNFLILFIYVFMLIYFIKFLFSKTSKSKTEKMFIFWSLTTLFMLFVLLLFEDTEIPRHRFPYEYIMLVFSIYFYKKNKAIAVKKIE